MLRKVLADGGARLERFLVQVEQSAQLEPAGRFAAYAGALSELTRRLREATRAIMQAATGQPALPYRVAPEMLRLIGHCALAHWWLRAARAALRLQAHDPVFYGCKQDTACYYFTYVLPEVQQLLGVIDACLHGCENSTHNAFPSDLSTHDPAQEAA